MLLLPAIAAAATAIVWVALLWLGWNFDGTWIWVVSLAAAIIAPAVAAYLLPRRRRDADAAMLESLARPRSRHQRQQLSSKTERVHPAGV